MTKKDIAARLLRWYPPQWSSHYGPGFEALLEDTYGSSSVPWRHRFSIAKSGLLERAREVGIVGTSASGNARLLAGSQLVLCGWSLFVVAGAIFAKFIEHWNDPVSSPHRALSSVSVAAVQFAGTVGVLLVLGAATFVVPSVVRLVRTSGWQSVRRPITKSALAFLVSIALTTSVALRAHFLNYHQRNGGSQSYVALVVLAGVAIIATLATMTATAISLSRQVDFSRRLLRNLSIAALALTVLMAGIALGSEIWWTNEALIAPRFLDTSIGNGIVYSSNSFPPPLLLMAALMILGLSMALVGVTRVISGIRHDDTIASPATPH